ncbi:MAG: GNAT family N-acetyltransferase [Anaerolineae bacterium]|nr:GNAT family N-acetyltransferase [Anaerolineae bacterium]
MQAIETRRLTIRNFGAEDWRDLHEMIVAYQAMEVAQYDGAWPTAEDKIRGIAQWFAGSDHYLAVCLRDPGTLIGLVARSPKEGSDLREFGFGYVFHPGHHGHGYATEACQAVLDHAFDELGAAQISTGTAEANVPSCRLLRRLGFRETGRGTGSLRKTEDGQPIEFVALSFVLTREAWGAERRPYHGRRQTCDRS